jgi:hypothetical protein
MKSIILVFILLTSTALFAEVYTTDWQKVVKPVSLSDLKLLEESIEIHNYVIERIIIEEEMGLDFLKLTSLLKANINSTSECKVTFSFSFADELEGIKTKCALNGYEFFRTVPE